MPSLGEPHGGTHDQTAALHVTSAETRVLYTVAHIHLPMLGAYRRAAATPIEPGLHTPSWSEVSALNRALGLRGEWRFGGVRRSLARVRELPHLTPREIVTLAIHPDERVPLALLRAVRPSDDDTLAIDPERRRLIVAEITERGRWLEALGARWNAFYDALVVLDLTMYAAATPLQHAIDSLAPWVEGATNPRALEPALRFRCAGVLELVASRIRHADHAFAEAVITRAPIAGPALVLNPHIDDALRTVIGDLAIARLYSLRPSDERVPHVAEWVEPFLAVRRNLMITLSAVRERQCQLSEPVMSQLVQEAALNQRHSAARASARCRTARLAMLALGVPVPYDIAEATYPAYAASLRSEMIRGTDWEPAPLVSPRFRSLAQAIRDVEYPLHAPPLMYVPSHIACPTGSAALERGAMLVASTLVRVLTTRALRQCLVQIARKGPRMVRRLLELATRAQRASIRRAFVRRLVPPVETQHWRQAMSLIPSARKDAAIRQRLIDTADTYIATQILTELTPAEQRQVFSALRNDNPADALAVLEQNIGGIQRALQPDDFTELLVHWAPEIRLRAQALLHTIGAPALPTTGDHAAPDGATEE